MKRHDPYTVVPLKEITLPRRLQRQLHNAQERHDTGVLLHGIIWMSPQSMSPKRPTLAIWEGKKRLCIFTSYDRRPRWASLEPGEHDITFHVSRSRSSNRFTTTHTLATGDILVAVCEPIQAWTIGKTSPLSDKWHISVLPAPQHDSQVNAPRSRWATIGGVISRKGKKEKMRAAFRRKAYRLGVDEVAGRPVLDNSPEPRVGRC